MATRSRSWPYVRNLYDSRFRGYEAKKTEMTSNIFGLDAVEYFDGQVSTIFPQHCEPSWPASRRILVLSLMGKSWAGQWQVNVDLFKGYGCDTGGVENIL